MLQNNSVIGKLMSYRLIGQIDVSPFKIYSIFSQSQEIALKCDNEDPKIVKRILESCL